MSWHLMVLEQAGINVSILCHFQQLALNVRIYKFLFTHTKKIPFSLFASLNTHLNTYSLIQKKYVEYDGICVDIWVNDRLKCFFAPLNFFAGNESRLKWFLRKNKSDLLHTRNSRELNLLNRETGDEKVFFIMKIFLNLWRKL